MTAPTLPRSFLYVPGNRPDLFAKAADGRADAIVLDLEDAVPVEEKGAAREHVAAFLGETRREEQAQVWVRVGADSITDDLADAAGQRLAGIVIATVSLEALDMAAGTLHRSPSTWTATPGPLPVVGLVETAAALRDLHALARHRVLTTFGLGQVDLLGDLRMRAAGAVGGVVVDLLRTQVVVACAAQGLAAPVAPTSTDFRDLDAFAASTRHLLDLGFRSRTAIHPAQVDVINAALVPTPDDVESARAVLARFASAGGGVVVGEDGRMIDAAVVREATETVSRAPTD